MTFILILISDFQSLDRENSRDLPRSFQRYGGLVSCFGEKPLTCRKVKSRIQLVMGSWERIAERYSRNVGTNATCVFNDTWIFQICEHSDFGSFCSGEKRQLLYTWKIQVECVFKSEVQFWLDGFEMILSLFFFCRFEEIKSVANSKTTTTTTTMSTTTTTKTTTTTTTTNIRNKDAKLEYITMDNQFKKIFAWWSKHIVKIQELSSCFLYSIWILYPVMAVI